MALLDSQTTAESSALELERRLDSLQTYQRVEEIGRFAREQNFEIVFGTSFGIEDQLITALVAASGATVRIFTLDTGRMFPETYDVWRETEERYGIKIQCYFPEAGEVERYTAEDGINGFYKSVASRQRCCGVRKIEPLGRALTGAGIWIAGLRREQDPERGAVRTAEYDQRFKLIKSNPLADLSTEEMWSRVKDQKIPYHKLHDRGFPSIGCAPCTRAVGAGEPIRAGRWWWEAGLPKECGLHHLFAGQDSAQQAADRENSNRANLSGEERK